MAETFPSLTGDLKRISECWLYRDPRVSRRARLHTFCRECKDRSTVTNDDSCPLCRPFFRIPEDGCGSIQKNYFMEKLVDLHQVHLESKLNLKGDKIIDIPLVEQFEVKEAGDELTFTAWLENKLYVTNRGSSSVQVFADRAPFEKLEETIEIQDLEETWSMTASAATRAIFISDKTRCIWKIQMPERELSRWEVDGEATYLSITPNSELLAGVTGFDGPGGPVSDYCQLYLFELRNASRKVIPLPSEITFITSVVQAMDETFIISYIETVPCEKYLISILSSDGQKMIKTVDPIFYDSILTEPRWQKFMNMYYFDVKDDGQIFAVDLDGDRLLLLNSDLTCCRVLSNNGHTIRGISRSVYIPEKQQLFVTGIKLVAPYEHCAVINVFHLSPCYNSVSA